MCLFIILFLFTWAYFRCKLVVYLCENVWPFVLYSHDTTIQIYRCREIRNTDDSPLFRYETFINFLTLVFRHEERDTQFLLCWLYYLTQQTRCASRSPKISVGGDPQNSMVRLQLQLPAFEADKPTVSYSQPPAGLARPRVESQLTSFSKSPNSQPIASEHDIIHTPVTFPIWGFIMTFVIVISSAHERELYSMCVHLH